MSEKKRIESRQEVQAYIDRLNYALRSSSVTVNFQKDRLEDLKRVMSFHFSEWGFDESDFPYREGRAE